MQGQISNSEFRMGKFLHELYYRGVRFLWANFWRINFPLENFQSLFSTHYESLRYGVQFEPAWVPC